MIKEDHVSFEIAKLLKEKGFDEICRAAYTDDGKFITNHNYYSQCEDECIAPTHQMAMKWLREKDIRICPDYSDVDGKWFTMIGTKKKRTYSGYYDIYEEAVEAALKYCLENLSIIGTSECLNYYLDEWDTCHYFSSDHENVINLEFDDISTDEMEYNGHIFTGLTMNQAEKLFKFIEKNIDKNFIIHCRAGKSRSQAVGSFIMNFYPDFTSDTILPFCNQDVYRKLSRCYYKKYNPEYEI